MIETAFLLLYIGSVIIALGYWLGSWQGEYPFVAHEHYWGDLLFSFAVSLTGPVAFIFLAIEDGFKYGWVPPWHRPDPMDSASFDHLRHLMTLLDDPELRNAMEEAERILERWTGED